MKSRKKSEDDGHKQISPTLACFVFASSVLRIVFKYIIPTSASMQKAWDVFPWVVFLFYVIALLFDLHKYRQEQSEKK